MPWSRSWRPSRAGKLTQPAGVASASGSLYSMAIDQVLRYDGTETGADVPPVDMTAAFN